MPEALAAALAATTLALAFLGLADALFFALVAFGRVRPDPSWLPAFCRMDAGTCGTIVATSHARLLGVPNAFWGVGWYAFAFTVGAAELAGGTPLPCLAVLVPATLAATYSVFLGSILAWRLRVVCAPCYLAHGLNFSLLLVFSVACAAP